MTEHVQKYLDTEEFSRRGAQLGEEVAQADRQIDQRLQQVFDHELSHIEAVPGEAAVPPAVVEPADSLEAAGGMAPVVSAVGIAELLATPELLGQAIVLNEILRRPEDRWA